MKFNTTPEFSYSYTS